MFLSLTSLGWSQNDLIPDPQAPVITELDARIAQRGRFGGWTL